MTPDGDTLISAGEFSRRTGLTRKTLRGYEEIGLLKPTTVDQHNGFRYYSEEQVQLGRLLHELRAANVPRAQLAEFVAALGDGMASPEEGAESIKTFLYQQARLMSGHQASVHRVIHRLSRPTGSPDREVEVRTASERLVLSGRSMCTASTIQGKLSAWDADLRQSADKAADGPMYMRFAQPVTEQLAGAVDFCLPVLEVVSPPPGCSLFHRESRLEALVLLDARLDPYPEIRSALETLLDWHLAEGTDISASAPEVHPGASPQGDTAVVWPFRRAE